MRKPTICKCENKDADQLRGNREADQRLCFRYTDSTFPPLLIPKFSRFWVSSVTVQAGLCWTWSEIQIVGFVMHRLIWYLVSPKTAPGKHVNEIYTRNLCFELKCQKLSKCFISTKNFHCYSFGKICILHGHVFVIVTKLGKLHEKQFRFL